MNGRLRHGELLTSGVNVDPVDVAAGLALAAQFGYGDVESQMVIEYALMRWRRGEEAGAERTIISHGIDYTTWRAALAAAVATATTEAAAPAPSSSAGADTNESVA